MIDLTTKYLGLDLKNPVVVGACGLTGSAGKIRELAETGVGAIVLKSLYEEQIEADLQQNIDSYQTDYPDAYDYVKQYTRDSAVTEYLDLISDVKRTTDVPIIASLNCVTAAEWTEFAKRIAEAGADALEINISLLPSDPRKSCDEYEQTYFDVLNRVTDGLRIPVSLKMGFYSSSMANLISRLCWTGKVNGFVLFARYHRPDININKMELTSAGLFSDPVEINVPLRWVALLAGMIECDIAASTGVHDSDGVVKMLLAGASAVQVVSTLYKGGAKRATEIISGLETWMEENSFSSLDEFRGRLAFKLGDGQSAYERIQFMKHYAGMS